VAKRSQKSRKGRESYRVFLSHSHHDRWIAEVLREKVEAVGVSVWLDAVDIPGGGNVKERVKRGMRESDECAVLLTPASRQSEWVMYELGMADILEIWLTPILLHVEPVNLPGPIRELNPIDINEFEVFLTQLTRRKAGKA
jgi:hypothetical protein